jgi:hypothetical protein
MRNRPGPEEPPWLHPYMMRWADATVRLAADRGLDAATAQAAASDVWRRIGARATEAPPLPGRVLAMVQDAADRRIRASGGRPDARWNFLRRLRAGDREALWIALYGDRPLESLAEEAALPLSLLMAALPRARAAAGSGGPVPSTSDEWADWLRGMRPVHEGAPRGFDWFQWDPGAAAPSAPSPLRVIGRFKPRHRLVGGAVLAAAAAAIVLARATAPPPPPTPFPLAGREGLGLLVDSSAPVYQQAFGGAAGPRLAGRALGGSLMEYRAATLGASDPVAGYWVAGIQLGVAVSGSRSALVLYGAQSAAVTLLSGAPQQVAATRRGRYAVFSVDGRAATVRVREGSRTLLLAWAAERSPRAAVAFLGGVWPGAPVARGFDGSYVFDAPKTVEATPIAVLKGGLLAQAGHTYWLLPPEGPAVPLFTYQASYAHEPPLVEAVPYALAADEVLVSGASGVGDAQWWNLRTDTWGPTAIRSGADTVLASPDGWVDATAGGDAAYSYGSPPTVYYMANDLTGAVAWGYRVLVERLAGDSVVATGVYDWRTRTYTSTVVPSALGDGAVAFPRWGPTYVQFSLLVGSNGQAFGGSTLYPGPGVVTFVPVNGRPSTSVTLSPSESLWIGPRWVVMTGSPGLVPNTVQVGWPGPHGHFRWRTITGPVNSTVSVSGGIVYWVTAQHVYAWLPAFARMPSAGS